MASYGITSASRTSNGITMTSNGLTTTTSNGVTSSQSRSGTDGSSASGVAGDKVLKYYQGKVMSPTTLSSRGSGDVSAEFFRPGVRTDGVLNLPRYYPKYTMKKSPFGDGIDVGGVGAGAGSTDEPGSFGRARAERVAADEAGYINGGFSSASRRRNKLDQQSDVIIYLFLNYFTVRNVYC